MYKKIKGKILKTLRLILLRNKVFVGRYSDCMIAASHFVAENNVLVQHYVIRDKMTANTVDETLPEDMKNKIRTEQKRELERNKEIRKAKKMILWYGWDTQLHRALGFKRTWYHRMLES